MSSQSTAPATPPRLILSVLLLAGSITAAFVFASAFKDLPAYEVDPTLCGDPAPEGSETADPHEAHGKKPKPAYYAGGLWSPAQGLTGKLEAAMLSAAAGKSIVIQSAALSGEDLVIIDHSPLGLPAVEVTPELFLSIDYAGSISSIEYPGAGALQKYITDQKANYSKITIVEPLPGPKADPDEDWTYLNFDGDEKITFFTPKRKASATDVMLALYQEARGSALPASSDIAALVDQLAGDNSATAADARWQLASNNPYQVVPALSKWIDAAEGETRENRLANALLIQRAMGVHADELIAEATASDNSVLRAVAARAIGDLADVTTDAIGMLTPLAEDDVMAVRYQALVATTKMPSRRAAGVAQLVEPYEMTDAMRAAYQGILANLLTYGEPIAADSRANRLRRMAINELLGEERGALVCAILLERTDLPDDKIDEVLVQLATANGRGPLVSLLNLLEAMNPRTLAQREVLLKKLIDWKTNELNAQTPRLKEMALGNGTKNLRLAAAAAIAMSSEPKAALTELDNSPIAYEGLTMVSDKETLKKWAGPAIEQIKAGTPAATTIAAIDAVPLLPAESLTAENGTTLLGLAQGAEDVEMRFAAIRAVNALPAGIKPPGTEGLTLTTLEVRAKAGMKYDKELLTVTASRPVELTLINPDTMEHNLVITLPGQAQAIGIAMSSDPTAAAAMGYVPKDDPAVLHYTGMLKPGQSQTLRFIAPTKPGKYEYVCTFPGHSASMNGVLEVVAP